MDLENRLIKLESRVIEMDQMNLELQVKVCQQGDKVDYLMDFIKTKFGNNDFCVRTEGEKVSSLVQIETNPVIRLRKIKDTTANIVNQSAELVNSDQDDGILSESPAINDRSAEELNSVEHVEVPFEVVEPIPGTKGKPGQKKKKGHTRHGRTNAVKLGFTLRTQDVEDNDLLSAAAVEPIPGSSKEGAFGQWKQRSPRNNYAENVDLNGSFREKPIHKKIRLTKKPFVCDWTNCGKRYTYRNSLNIHKRTHSEERLHICRWENCRKRFYRKHHLVEHTAIHTREKPFVCYWENCVQRFIKKSHLTRHFRTHTGEKPFECDLEGCGRRFISKFELTRHVRTHTGEKPFECHVQGCGIRFASSSEVLRHKKTRHFDLKL